MAKAHIAFDKVSKKEITRLDMIADHLRSLF
jgi:hypothetical protein